MPTATSFYGIPLTTSGRAEATTGQLLDVFELLRPRATATPLIRVGGDEDGSYLVPEGLAGIAACFSPGVNRIKHFEDFLADEYGIASHMCDFSSDVGKLTTPLRPGLQTFVKKWLDPTPGEDNVALEDWMAEHDVPGDLLLQMDIEGAEYRNILATSDETLARFRVVVLEVHGLDRMLEGPVLAEVVAPFFTKLAQSFTTVHAHPNNCCSDFAIPGTDVRVPRVLELTLIRHDHVVPAPGPPLLPHPLDVSRNVPRKPPLFLSPAWCGGVRPLESRVKVLEDTLAFRSELGVSNVDPEFSSALSLTMQSLRTLSALVLPAPDPDGLVEVAGGRPFELSSAHATTRRTGAVGPRGRYFFHTGFGPDQAIRVDLGRSHRVRRIELSNRLDGYRERSRHLFALLDGPPGSDERHVFPIYPSGPVPAAGWQECAIDLPGVDARYVTITSPVKTELHLADLRVYAEPDAADAGRSTRPTVRRLLGRARRRVRRWAGRPLS